MRVWPDLLTFENMYSASCINDYVVSGLERMYTGTAPTLKEISGHFGRNACCGLIATMLKEVLKFAGCHDFTKEEVSTLSGTILARYDHLKITELMHFVYLFRTSELGEFYGRPSSSHLMKMLKLYVDKFRERYLSEYSSKIAKESSQRDATSQRQRCTPECKELIALECENLNSSLRLGRKNWRYHDFSTAACRAHFVDHTLETFPGDMTLEQLRDWASQNLSLIEEFPNFNKPLFD